MKLHQTQRREVHTTGQFRSAEMAITDKKGIAMAVHFLRDKLYTNKVRAVVREYFCNAKDEHEKYCPDRPVDITLPTFDNKVYKVRDYGKGLSEDDMFNVFGPMFKSTKADEAKAIGGFGIGAKAGHAYGDSFSVISWHEGTKSYYEAVLETNVDPESGEELTMGKLYKIHEEVSDEPSGIEVTVAVKERDIGSFRNEAENLFRFLTVKPNVEGGSINFLQRAPIREGEGWALYERYLVAGGSGVLIGEIFYPVNASEVPFFSTGIVLSLGLNEVSIAPNREGLEYTNRTKKVLELKYKKAFDEIIRQIQDKVDSADDWLKARIILAHELDDFYSGSTRKLLVERFTYEGEAILPSAVVNHKCTVYKPFDNDIGSYEYNQHMLESNNILYYVIGNNTGGKNRARTLLNEKPDARIVVFKFKDNQEFEAFQKRTRIKQEHFEGDFKEIDPTRKTYTRVSSSGKKIGRASIGKSHLHSFSRRGYSHTETWPKFKESPTDDDTYVWVPLGAYDRGSYFVDGLEIDGTKIEFKQINAIWDIGEALGISTKFVGVRESGRDRVPDNWIALEDWVKDTLLSKENVIKLEERIEKESSRAMLTESNWSTWQQLVPHVAELPGEIGEFITDLKEAMDTTIPSYTAICCAAINELTFVKFDGVKEKSKLADLSKKFMKQYPLVSYIRVRYGHDTATTDFVNYINALNEKNND